MNLTDRVIWIVSPERWGKHRVSKHHYALELVRRGNEVVFIEPHHDQAPAEVSEHNRLTLLNFRVTAGARQLPRLLARKMIARDLRRIAKLTNTLPDLIWSFDNSRLFELDALDHRYRKIHHVVDLNQDFELARAASTADLCLATTRHISARLMKYNANTHNIGHGCAMDPATKWSSLSLRRPQVVYSGNLLIPLIDHDLVLKAIRQHPEADFIFVGAYDASNLTVEPHPTALEFIGELRKSSNVKLLGARSGEAYRKVLSSADVFITAYRQDAREQVANPHKIPEMLSTGRAIVSNVLDAYLDSDLLDMAHDHNTWLALLRHALTNLETVNSPARQQARITFAQDRHYSRLVTRIEELLQA